MPKKKNSSLKFIITISFLSSLVSSLFVVTGLIYYLENHPSLIKSKEIEANISIEAQIDAGIERYIQKQQQQAGMEEKASQDKMLAQRNSIPKNDKPEIELFIMSHCPFGTQIEKGILPPLYLLKGKIDFKLKFVDYAMHPDKELSEQVTQYCIREKTDKILDYLSCFLETGASNECLQQNNIDPNMIAGCSKSTDEKFKITKTYQDKTAWSGRYPPFDIDKEDARKYEILGSPTLIVNGQEAPTGRDPASLLETICLGFSEKPSECSQKLSTTIPSPGFGNETSGLDVDCAG